MDAMAQARSLLPERYHPYLIQLKGNPYVNVDGRTLMAIDAAQEANESLSIHTEPCEVFGQPCIKATVTIGARSATGTASIHFGGTGADATNPIENGETSAVGRALGFLGFGLLGYGIASADEMQGAMSREKIPGKPERPATERQVAFIRRLCKDLGLGDRQVTEELAKVETAAQASEVIERLQALKGEQGAPEQIGQSTKIDATTKLLAYAEKNNLTARLHELMLAEDLQLQDLTPEKAQWLHAKLRADVSETHAQADAGNEQALWAQQVADADAEAATQEDTGFGPDVPNMASRKA